MKTTSRQHPAAVMTEFFARMPLSVLERALGPKRACRMKLIHGLRVCPGCGLADRLRHDYQGPQPCSWVSDGVRFARLHCHRCGEVFVRPEIDGGRTVQI